jgi:hypothetical protein
MANGTLNILEPRYAEQGCVHQGGVRVLVSERGVLTR